MLSNNTPPSILTEAGLNMFIDTAKLAALPLPIIDMPVSDLLWHFDMPIWAKDETDDWNLTPWEVIEGNPNTMVHRKRVDQADIQYPILVTNYKSKLVILDGVHRLVKIYENGSKVVRAKMIPAEYLSQKAFQT